MPSYHEVMTTDLSTLTKAAAKWDEMAKDLHDKVATRYHSDVLGITLSNGWLGTSSEAANKRFRVTYQELEAAQKEAKAVASLLRDAHAQFVAGKKRVTAARDAAIRAKMGVTDQGVCFYDPPQDSSGGGSEDGSRGRRAAAERQWTEQIAAAVRSVDDADDGVRVALQAVVVDSDPGSGMIGGFNAAAQGDVEIYESREATATARRLINGDEVSDTELARFQQSLRDNQGDKNFSRTLFDDLGPNGTVLLANRLNEQQLDAGGNEKVQLADIQRNLGNSMATATAVPGSVRDMPPGSPAFAAWANSPDGQFYKTWNEELQQTGRKNYGSNANPLYGYSAYAALMQHADRDYDDQFLYDLTRQTMAAEKEQPGIYETWGAGHEGIRSDAVDSVLDVMSRNPDAATAFFDPAGVGSGANHVDEDHLKYLAGSGEGTREWPKWSTSTPFAVSQMDDPLSRAGLGLALEAATTGKEPLAEGQRGDAAGFHRPDQARVMQDLVKTLDEGSHGEDVHQNLRQPLGHALADYTADNHGILAESAGHNVAGGEVIDRGKGSASIDVPKDSLIRVMRGVSADDQSYALLQDSQRLYALEQLDNAGSSGAEKNAARDMGMVTGTMNGIGADVIRDERDGKVAATNDMGKYAYNSATAPLTALPMFGVADKVIDMGVYSWTQDVATAADHEMKAKGSQEYYEDVGSTYGLIDIWAESSGIDTKAPPGSEDDPGQVHWKEVRGEARQSYTSGRDGARAALGGT